MSLRQRSRRLGLPTTHYFLSVCRGDSIRTAMLRPALLWALIALTPLTFAFGLAGAADLAFRDRLTMTAAAQKPARETGDEVDDTEIRRAADQDPLEGRMRDLAARQDRLERRGAVAAALAAEAARAPSPALPAAARVAADALGAIETLGPKRVPDKFRQSTAARRAPTRRPERASPPSPPRPARSTSCSPTHHSRQASRRSRRTPISIRPPASTLSAVRSTVWKAAR